MSSQRRVTRSARADIPDIPLPPRRDPPKKNETRPLNPSSGTTTTSTFLKLSQKASSSLWVVLKPGLICALQETHPMPTRLNNDLTAVADCEEPISKTKTRHSPVGQDCTPLSPRSATQLDKTSVLEATNATTHLQGSSRGRPRPKRITSSWKTRDLSLNADDIDSLLISTRAGFRYRPGRVSSPKPAPRISPVNSSPPRRTSTDLRRSVARREVTPAPEDDEDGLADGETDSDEDGLADKGNDNDNHGLLNHDFLAGEGHKNDGSEDENDGGDGQTFPENGHDDPSAPNDKEPVVIPQKTTTHQRLRRGRLDANNTAIPREDPIESEGSGSDFEEAEAVRRRKEAYKRSLAGPASPTMSEQDEEDERTFEEAVSKLTPSPPRIPASMKGKGRARDPPRTPEPDEVQDSDSSSHHLDESDGGDGEGEDDNMAHTYSSGPVPEAEKAAAREAHAEMISKLEAIAQRCNKPMKYFLSLVGQNVKPSRCPSPWHVFQHWFNACVKKKPVDVNIQTWNKYEVSTAYKKKMKVLYNDLGTTNPTREQIKEHLKEQYDFFGGTITNYLVAKHDSKKFAAVVSKVVEPFIRMSTQVSEEFGIHIFGFAIETTPESCSSVAWGGSHEYKTLRDQHKTVIQTQLHDYEGMFKVAEMHGRANPASKFKSFVDIRKKTENESERDYLRRILGEFLCSDLARIFSERDKISDASGVHNKAKMNWSWTDYAYKQELRIIGWEKDVAFPKKQFDPKKISHGTLKRMVKPRIAWYQCHLEAYDDTDNVSAGDGDPEEGMDDDEEFSKLVQIVSWTDEEKSRRLKDKRTIPLVVDVTGRALLTVFDSDNYIASLRNIGVTVNEDDHYSDVSNAQSEARSAPTHSKKAPKKQPAKRKNRDFEAIESNEEGQGPSNQGRREGRSTNLPRSHSNQRSRSESQGSRARAPHSQSRSCVLNSEAAQMPVHFSRHSPPPSQVSQLATVPRTVSASDLHRSNVPVHHPANTTCGHSPSLQSECARAAPAPAPHSPRLRSQSQDPPVQPGPSYRGMVPQGLDTHLNTRSRSQSVSEPFSMQAPPNDLPIREAAQWIRPPDSHESSRTEFSVGSRHLQPSNAQYNAPHNQLYPKPRRPMNPQNNQHWGVRPITTSRQVSDQERPQVYHIDNETQKKPNNPSYLMHDGHFSHENQYFEDNEGDRRLNKRRRVNYENRPPSPQLPSNNYQVGSNNRMVQRLGHDDTQRYWDQRRDNSSMHDYHFGHHDSGGYPQSSYTYDQNNVGSSRYPQNPNSFYHHQ